ncbi:MAG: ATP-binding protein [Coprococcus sp.]
MDTSSVENLKIVKESNKDMLDYFNDLYVHKLELVQELKTEQFELKSKIDELVKTLNIYSFKNSTGQNVFSPFSTENTIQQEKAAQIETQLHELMNMQTSIDDKISNFEQEIDSLKKRITTLNTSNKKLEELIFSAEAEIEACKIREQEISAKEDEDDILDEVDDAYEDEISEEPDINHGLNILMLHDYERKQFADKLDTEVAETIDSNLHKLEVLSRLLKSDINRASITLDELITSNDNLLDCIDGMIDDLAYNIDTTEPVWTLLDDIMLEYKESHPECVIESEIECPDYDITIPDIITSNLVIIIREIMDNAFKHSNANRIVVNIYISSRLIDVSINDNGVGIDSNFSHVTPWYSGLHRIREIIYLLGGQFKIDGDIISGTNVRFSFLVDEN